MRGRASRIDRGLGPGGGLFARRESVLSENVEEQRAVRVAGKRQAPQPPLDAGLGEEAAVQKRNAAERPRRARSSPERCVEGTEKERAEHSLVEASAVRRASVEVSHEKPAIAVEPSLGFEKREEHESRGVEQRCLVAFHPWSDRRRVSERRYRALQRLIEARGERVASQDLHPSHVREHVAFAGRDRESAQRFGVAVDRPTAIHDDGRDAWWPSLIRPSSDDDFTMRALRRDEHPERVSRARGEAAGVPREDFADRGVVSHREEKRAKGAAAGRHARLDDGIVEPQCALGLFVEWRGIAVATDRTRDRRDAGRGISRGEKLGGGVKRCDGHAPTLALDARRCAITPLRNSSIRLRGISARRIRALSTPLDVLGAVRSP